MTKLIYPEEGINTLVNGYHKNATDYLSYAYNQTGFDLPTSLGYSYRNYLYSLDDKLRTYIREMNSIGGNIKQIDNKMDITCESCYRDVIENFKEKKELERERLID